MIANGGRHLPVIGIVGGIGSGKSSLCRRLAETEPFLVLDADRIGHQVLTEVPVQSFLRERFGPQVFAETGAVDRAALAAEVFGDTPERRQAREDLEAIVHPRIRQIIEDRIREVCRNEAEPGSVEAVLLDAAVLLESDWQNLCDAVVFVDVPRTIREQRVADRGWPPGELARREASQMGLDAKREASDFVVDNSGSLNSAAEQFLNWFRKSSDLRLSALTNRV